MAAVDRFVEGQVVRTRIGAREKFQAMRGSRRTNGIVAVVAVIISVAATLSNVSNVWDPLNFMLRIVAGTVAVVAGARWLTLNGVREARNPPASKDNPEGGA